MYAARLPAPPSSRLAVRAGLRNPRQARDAGTTAVGGKPLSSRSGAVYLSLGRDMLRQARARERPQNRKGLDRLQSSQSFRLTLLSRSLSRAERLTSAIDGLRADAVRKT